MGVDTEGGGAAHGPRARITASGPPARAHGPGAGARRSARGHTVVVPAPGEPAEPGEPAVVQVLPDVPAVDRTFSYTVPERFAGGVALGTRVRIVLHGRRVGGWIVAFGALPIAEGVTLRPLAGLSGWGPFPDVIELAAWGAWRWAGRRATFLRTASPRHVVRSLPEIDDAGWPPAERGGAPDPPEERGRPDDAVVDVAAGEHRGILRIPPCADTRPWVEALRRHDVRRATHNGQRPGQLLVLHPATDGAAAVAAYFRHRGVPVGLLPQEWDRAAAGVPVVVGTRVAAWASLPWLGRVVVLDAHDERHREERAPTWDGRVVAAERAALSGVACTLMTPCPTVEQLAWGELVTLPRPAEHQGWPVVEVVDRRGDDPRLGLFSERVVTAVRAAVAARGDPVVCVYNRTGAARLVACNGCGSLARCEVCDAPVATARSGQEEAEDQGRRGVSARARGEGRELVCPRCGARRPPVCASCGRRQMRVVQPGVGRVASALEALAGTPVVEIGKTSGPLLATDLPAGAVVVGTEAVLHRVHRAALVVFVDFDQELVAARFRAGEQAFARLVLAARLAGSRRARGRPGARPPAGSADGRGRVLLQTRAPDHPVVRAAAAADPSILAQEDTATRRALALPPFSALAELSGPGAGELASWLGNECSPAVDVSGSHAQGRWLVRGPDHATVCDALRAAPAPRAHVRIDVDPTGV